MKTNWSKQSFGRLHKSVYSAAEEDTVMEWIIFPDHTLQLYWRGEPLMSWRCSCTEEAMAIADAAIIE